MARSKSSVSVPVVNSATELDEDEELTPEESDVLAALTELDGGADAKWQVYRLAPSNDPVNKPVGFCDELSSAEISMKEVQRRFGRGKYRIKGFKSSGGYLAHKTVTIATDPPKEVAAPALDPHKDFFSRMEEREIRAQERRDKMMELIIPGALTALTGIFTAMMSRPQSDPIQMIAALKTLAPAAPDNSALVLKLIEVAAGKGESDEPAWLGFAKEAAKDLLPALTAKLNGAPPASVSMGALPAPSALPDSVTPAAELPPSNEEATMLKLIGWARQSLAFLVQQAANNRDPEVYAQFLLDNVPPGVNIDDFAKYLDAPNWWEAIQSFCPAVAPYKGWFEEFREVLLAIRDGDGEEGAAPSDESAQP